MTRRGCPQCEHDEELVARLARRYGASYAAVDVDRDPQALAAYGDRVPVVLVDAKEHSVWAVDARALRRRLRAAGRSRPRE